MKPLLEKFWLSIGFEINYLKFNDDTVSITIKNTKFRSTAQAVGRVASTLQRFTSDDIQFANISFYSKDLHSGELSSGLRKNYCRAIPSIGSQVNSPSITAIDIRCLYKGKKQTAFYLGCWTLHCSPPL